MYRVDSTKLQLDYNSSDSCFEFPPSKNWIYFDLGANKISIEDDIIGYLMLAITKYDAVEYTEWTLPRFSQPIQFYALRTLEQTSDVSFGCTQACCKIMAFCKERKTSRLMLLLKGNHNFLFRGGSWEQRGPLFVTELQRDKIPKLPLREREWRRTILSYPIPKNP